MSTEAIKYADIAELRAEGYIQEVNRLFFHPHGLALEVMVDDDGTERLSAIWDYRDDPEGTSFGSGWTADPAMAARAKQLAIVWDLRCAERRERLGYDIQPLEES